MQGPGLPYFIFLLLQKWKNDESWWKMRQAIPAHFIQQEGRLDSITGLAQASQGNNLWSSDRLGIMPSPRQRKCLQFHSHTSCDLHLNAYIYMAGMDWKSIWGDNKWPLSWRDKERIHALNLSHIRYCEDKCSYSTDTIFIRGKVVLEMKWMLHVPENPLAEGGGVDWSWC